VEVGQRSSDSRANIDRWVDELVIAASRLLAWNRHHTGEPEGSYPSRSSYFTLYYLLINANKVPQALRPTSYRSTKKHSEKLLYGVQTCDERNASLNRRDRHPTRPVILTIIFLLVGVPGSFFWGALACGLLLPPHRRCNAHLRG
jgi:hypothetical protein